MTKRYVEKKRMVASPTVGVAADSAVHLTVVSQFCDSDLSALEGVVVRLASEIRVEYGSPGFGDYVRALVSDARAAAEEAHGEDPPNGHVPLFQAEEGMVFVALEEIARDKAHREALTIAAEIERGTLIFPADCELFTRIALVHGSLKTYNRDPWDQHNLLVDAPASSIEA